MSVAMLPKYAPEGAFEDETPDEAATRLHLEKNFPPPPPVRLKPTERREFPYALYREWQEHDRMMEELKVAQKGGLDLNDPRQYAMVQRQLPPFDSILAVDEADRTRKREQGWCDSPGDLKAHKAAHERARFVQAGERNFDDRHLSETAKAEIEQIDDLADDHVIDVDETRRKLQEAGALPTPHRGRKRTV